jgi:carboxyl-terminal processing protease
MRNRALIAGTMALVAAYAGGLFFPHREQQNGAVAANAQVYKNLELFGSVLAQVRARYVDKPDDAKLMQNAINGMLTGLDPHSSYLSVKEFQDELVETRGEFGGLGIDVVMENGVVKVVAPLAGMPAERAGVLADDAITGLDGHALQGMNMNQAVDKMRGPVGSTITLTIVRKGVSTPISVKVTRDIIRIIPVQYSVEGDVAWIKVKTFENEHTTDYLERAVEAVKMTLKDKLAGYVVDLRNNPGGLLVEAINISDAFLDRGAIVITKGRTSNDIERASAKPGDITGGKPIVVLINGGSASASEIVAGALQDHKRAALIGTRSFGKGSVQTMIPLGEKGALRLTTARYYTPSGRSIQATGIEPDYLVEQELPDALKLRADALPFESEAQLRGHLRNDEASEVSGSISYVPKEKEKDTQLQAAIELLHGKAPVTSKKSVAQARAAPAEKPASQGAHGG